VRSAGDEPVALEVCYVQDEECDALLDSPGATFPSGSPAFPCIRLTDTPGASKSVSSEATYPKHKYPGTQIS
jgi:hypothetical protein